MKDIKSKKSLVALILVAVLGIIGVTIAYFTSTDTFTSVFNTKSYGMEVVETFESPSDWTPGTTTDKTIVASNTGNVPAALRVSYTESWVDSSGDPLPLKDGDNNSAAIINFGEGFEDNWIESTESGVKYYYYYMELAENEVSSSFMESVTFNPDVTIDIESNCESDTDSHTTTCTTTTGGYAGGTYTLTVTVETVQFDQYKTAWGTSVDIQEAPASEG